MLSLPSWAITLACGGAVAVVAAAIAAVLPDRRLRRRLDIAHRFLDLIGRAHGCSPDGGRVGPGEQRAAVALVDRFGRRHRWLRRSADAALTDLANTEGLPGDDVTGVAATTQAWSPVGAPLRADPFRTEPIGTHSPGRSSRSPAGRTRARHRR